MFTGKEIKSIRKDILCLSQSEFATACNLSQQMISFIENERFPVTEYTDQKIKEGVYRYIDPETLRKLLSGEIPL